VPSGFTVVPASYVALLRPGASGPEVLMMLREGTGYMDGYWALIAGHVEFGETCEQAAVREVAEEVGLRVEPAELEPLTAMHRSSSAEPIDQRVDFFFACRRWEEEPMLVEPDKAAGLDWFALVGLPDPVVPHELRVLRALAQGRVPAVLSHFPSR
jgi:8-oxo-dGTP pyrophosphatase MutT (NUDIX family)